MNRTYRKYPFATVINLFVYLLSLFGFLSLCWCKPDIGDVMPEIEHRYNRRDTAGLMHLFHPDVQITIGRYTVIQGKEQAVHLVDDLMILDSHIHFKCLDDNGQTVSGTLAESNRGWLASGTGKGIFHFTCAFSGRLIHHIRFEPCENTSAELGKIRRRFLAWLSGQHQDSLFDPPDMNMNSLNKDVLHAGIPFFKAWIKNMEQLQDRNRNFDHVMQIIGIESGMKVADIGAGDGIYTFQLANRVGPTGTVYAVDIDMILVTNLAHRCRTENIVNVTPVLGKPLDPLLPVTEYDVFFLRHTLHCMTEPREWLKRVKAYFCARTRLVIIDGDPDILGYGWKTEHSKEEIVAMAEEAGFRLIRIELCLLPEDFIYIFVIR